MKLFKYKFVTGITPWLIGIVLMISGTGSAFAYEVSTHQEMSRIAFSSSILATDASLIDDLGINATDPFLNSNLKERGILDLVLDGSEFEDAIWAIDPDDEDLRMKHHFYNQQNGGRSLVYPSLGLGPNALIKTYSSADWALEDLSDIPEQNFSLNDAYDSFYKALTDLPNRKIHWGWVFQSLGHTIHHVQDMAQPQHTRNDAHTPLEDAKRKLYESYTQEEEKNKNLYLGYPDIDITQFNSARMFWDGVNATENMGLSEFSSENFVSEGTNFSGGGVVGTYVVGANPVSGQALPATDNLKITSTEQFFNFTIPTSWLLQTGFPFPFTDITVSGTRHDIGTQVTDYHYALNSYFNERTSTFSVIDSDIEAIGGAMIYALDRTNYDEAHKFLIPKAVAYSAGLINYFFRGRIEASLTDDGDGIEIKNVSEGDFDFGVADSFEVYYETDSGTRNPINNLSNRLLVSRLPVNGTHTITGLSAALESISDMGAEGKITVLFDGQIGSERGIAVTQQSMGQSDAGILFLSNRDGNPFQIYVTTNGQSGINVLQLSNNQENGDQDSYPAWSPDKSKIVFVRRKPGTGTQTDINLYTMNADGSNKQQLTNGHTYTQPDWSPVGNKIAFAYVPGVNTSSDIGYINSDGGNLTILTNHSGSDTKPSWSPSGDKIVYRGHINPSDSGPPGLIVMNADGSSKQLLISGADHPEWSPVEDVIAFTMGTDIYTINGDGTNLQNITLNYPPVGFNSLAWSPDGTKILFQGVGGLNVIDSDGSNVRIVIISNSDPFDIYGQLNWAP